MGHEQLEAIGGELALSQALQVGSPGTGIDRTSGDDLVVVAFTCRVQPAMLAKGLPVLSYECKRDRSIIQAFA